MALFLSTTINKLDKKGRVSVPATFRSTLGSQNGVVLFRSMRFAAIEGCDLARMEQLSQGLDNFAQFSAEQSDLSASIFADAQPLPFDGEGRIVLPQGLIDYAKIKDSAAFVGCGATFQIWNPDSFAKHQAEARGRVQKQELGIRLRQIVKKEENP